MLLAPPADMPRLVNLRKRGFEEKSWAGADPQWSRAHGQSPYDGSAGFLNKWEHKFVAMGGGRRGAEFRLPHRPRPGDRSGERWTATPAPFSSATANTGQARSGTPSRRSWTRGGNLAILSGNTAFWKVRWENDGRTMICHKWAGFDAEPSATADPASGTHLWSHPAFAATRSVHHRPQLHLRRLSPARPLRGAGDRRLHRLSRQALGAGGLRPLLRRRGSATTFQSSATRTTAAASPSARTACPPPSPPSACRRTWRSSPWPPPLSPRRPALTAH